MNRDSNNSHELQDLLTKLLAKSPQERLGTNGGAEEVLSHPWFADLDKEGLLNATTVAPLVPNPQGGLLNHNFEAGECEALKTDIMASVPEAA